MGSPLSSRVARCIWQIEGLLSQIIGPVVDLTMISERGVPPTTGSSVSIHSRIGSVTCEILNLLSESSLRGVSMSGTDGLRRGEQAEVLDGPITVPVGKNTLGRIFNVLGETVDGMGTLAVSARQGIHRDAPPYVSLDTTRAIFESGIKVVDG